MKKRLAGILAAVMVVFSSVLPVMASEGPVLQAVESDALGSITVQLEDTSGNRPKDGVCIGIVQVADVVDGLFVLREPYKKSGIDLNKLYTANELEAAAEKLEKIAGTAADKKILTDKNGVASVSELDVGVYLIYAIDTAKYEDISTAIVAIPTVDADGTMEYDIELLPKHSTPPGKITTDIFSTGIEHNASMYILFSMIAAAAGASLLLSTRKKKDK